MRPDTVRIASYPDITVDNPYLELFYQALDGYGICATRAFRPIKSWLTRHSAEVDAVHLHWPEHFWRGYRSHVIGRYQVAFRNGWLEKAALLLSNADGVRTLVRSVKRARTQGLRIIWTVHNVEPHEGASAIDRVGFRELSRNVDLIICHSQSAARELRQLYPSSQSIVVMPIGNYDGVYPPAGPMEITRRGLGLSLERPVVLCIGSLRNYKGLDLACDALSCSNGEIQLIIAGEPHAGFELRKLRSRAQTLSGLRLIERRVSDQEFADLVSASDAVLLPYRRITGSSVLMAAVTLSRGVIASDLPYFREVLGKHPRAGALFREGNAESLTDAISRFLKIPAALRSKAARDLADEYAWSRIVAPACEIIRNWKFRSTQARFVNR